MGHQAGGGRVESRHGLIAFASVDESIAHLPMGKKGTQGTSSYDTGYRVHGVRGRGQNACIIMTYEGRLLVIIYIYIYIIYVLCVFFPSILDIKFVGRTSRGHTGGGSHRIFNPPSFCGACLDFCREKDSAIPFPRRP